MKDKQDIWHVVEITTRWEAEEAIEFALNELDALGTEINNLGKKRAEKIKVNGYFDQRPGDQHVTDQLFASLRIHDLPDDSIESIEWNIIENKDWLAEWKKHWRPTEVGRFVIAPPWSEVTSSNIVIRIEPNMAFGTGTHETTQLCLEAIGEIYKPDQTFLDVGTGTGILAIAAAKLGGSSIAACDTDTDSVRIARENAAANDVADTITFFDGPIDDLTPIHDFVCANLTLDVISPILPLLIAKTRCVLLLSGILAEQEPAIGQELRYLSIQDFEVKQAGEWISVLVSFSQLS
jgi:ribosomal protein L11 methyltransferase